jgi:hypothetical protein
VLSSQNRLRSVVAARSVGAASGPVAETRRLPL